MGFLANDSRLREDRPRRVALAVGNRVARALRGAVPPMRPVALIRTAALKPLVITLQVRGVRVAALLERAALPADALRHGERLIPLRQAFRFLADTARSERLPDLGLLAGESASIVSLGVAGRLLRHARTLGEGLAAFIRENAKFSSGERWWLDVANDRARLCHAFVDPSWDGHDEAGQYGIALAVNLIRTVAGPGWSPSDVGLTGAPVGGLTERTTLLRGTCIAFHQLYSWVAFPSELLARPMPPDVTAGVPDDLDHWNDSAPAADFVGSVRQVMWSLTSGTGHPSMRKTAVALGVSVRTLQRRLAEDGFSFEQLLQADRLRMATGYLEETDARVLDIALDLGYSDHAHFTRAFRRWTGLTPLEYRRIRSSRAHGRVGSTFARTAATASATP